MLTLACDALMHCFVMQVRRRFGLVSTTSSSSTSTSNSTSTAAAATSTRSTLCVHIAGGGAVGGQLALIGDTSLAQITREVSKYYTTFSADKMLLLQPLQLLPLLLM
jgi:hypothetical protein